MADSKDNIKYKIIENFCAKVINDTKFYKHSDIDHDIRFRITGILNYFSILTPKEQETIKQNSQLDYKYISEIQKNKHMIVNQVGKVKQGTSGVNKNLLGFEAAELEVFFRVSLFVNHVEFKPIVETDLVLNESFDIQVNLLLRIKSVTPNSYIKVTIHSFQLPPEESMIGSTVIHLFNANMNFLQGRHIAKVSKEPNPDISKKEFNQVERQLADLIGNFSLKGSSGVKAPENIINSIPINENYIHRDLPVVNTQVDDDTLHHYYMNRKRELLSKLSNAYLEVDFAQFSLPIIYEEEKYSVCQDFYTGFTYKNSSGPSEKIVDKNWICDQEIRKFNNFLVKDNPITEKFFILSFKNDEAFAKDVRPTATEAVLIEELMTTPDFVKLKASELILFWKYRYHLLNRRNCLTKILNSVQWGDVKTENEFLVNILQKWTTIEIGDILYMLSFKFCMNLSYVKNVHSKWIEVRNFAVNQLDNHTSNELEFVLLQLVQAIKYDDPKNSPLRNYLIQRCAKDLNLATSFYWFLCVEADDSNISKSKSKDPVEAAVIAIYKNILNDFKSRLPEDINERLESQILLRKKLILVAEELGKCKKAEQRSATLPEITRHGGSHDISNFGKPLTLPLEPDIQLTGAIPNEGRVFVSAKNPVKYSFKVTNESQKFNQRENPSQYDLMFKYGDDLRQDQLILQIINYIDNLLRKVHLDFEFTTYKALATSKSDGFVEFVPKSKTISEILKKNKDSILPFLSEQAEKSNVSFETVKESYINSCAGYCVVTFILGIGDRHLENILINSKGKLFHIDFGFILGSDPKPYPPPVKLCKQMVECMGGKNSPDYEKFKRKCVDAYNYLRQNVRLIVNMFYLMIHCGIKELSENPEVVLSKLHDKFVPNMNIEEASNSLVTKLEESVNAVFTILMDKFHDWAKYWK